MRQRKSQHFLIVYYGIRVIDAAIIVVIVIEKIKVHYIPSVFYTLGSIILIFVFFSRDLRNEKTVPAFRQRRSYIMVDY
jgi:hypothetical protein